VSTEIAKAFGVQPPFEHLFPILSLTIENREPDDIPIVYRPSQLMAQ